MNAVTATGTTVTPSPAHTPTTFQKIMAVLEALEPVVLAGVSPFIKNAGSQALVAAESPIAQTLLQALAAL